MNCLFEFLLHMDVFEILHFNCTKVKSTLFSVKAIHLQRLTSIDTIRLLDYKNFGWSTCRK